MKLPAFGFSAALLAISCRAHFTLDYPPTRGFDEDIEDKFCGGFKNTGSRSPFPLSGGVISLTSTHEQASILTLISFDVNPQNFTAFNTTSSGASIPYLKPWFKISPAGQFCYPVDVKSLGVEGVQNGTNATILITFDGGDGNLYQCADITLSSSATVPSGTRCTNTTSLVGGSQSSSSSAASTPTSSAAATSNSLPRIDVTAASALGLLSAAVVALIV